MLAEENLGDGRAALLAGILGVQQRGNLVEPAPRIHAAAAGEGDDGVRIGRGDGFDQRVLSPGQREGAVVSFALGDRGRSPTATTTTSASDGKLSRVGGDQLRLIDDAQAEADAGDMG